MSQTQELFVKNENGKWLLDRFGIDDIYPDGYEELIDDSSWSNRLSENIICEITYGVTVKTGYWEMTVTHTKPVSIPSPSDGEPNE